MSEPEVSALELAASPVHAPGEPEDDPKPGIALCLSGGGYRAMLFHLGTLRRLNELGYLAKLDRVSSVSGGSITSGALARSWGALTSTGGVARAFDTAVAAPFTRSRTGRSTSVRACAGSCCAARSPTAWPRLRRASARRHEALGAAGTAAFVFNATNLQSGALWRFSKPYMWDYRVGKVDKPQERLAVAVAASSAFPPFLSPLTLRLDVGDYEPGTGKDLQREEYMRRPVLTDGGVYDNLGLETAWKRYRTILVSDGGGHFSSNSGSWPNWGVQAHRVLGVIDGQVRALRKRQVIGGYRLPKRDGVPWRDGAYWSIWSEQKDFPLADPLPVPTNGRSSSRESRRASRSSTGRPSGASSTGATRSATPRCARTSSLARRSRPHSRFRTRPCEQPMLEIEMLPAGNGDALWIEYDDGVCRPGSDDVDGGTLDWRACDAGIQDASPRTSAGSSC